MKSLVRSLATLKQNTRYYLPDATELSTMPEDKLKIVADVMKYLMKFDNVN